jgi:hypothetical protein
MHAAVPESEVIWYDAVTVSGALAWQNMLNTQNAPFFDVCDGIFLNYHWQPNMLERSKVNAKRGRKRNFDVYAGIDVFGRGTFGGGGMKSKASCNVASIFAQFRSLFLLRNSARLQFFPRGKDSHLTSPPSGCGIPKMRV